MELITLLRELTMVWEKDIDNDYNMDWEVQISIFYVVLVRDSDLNRNSFRDSYAEKTC